MFTFRALICVAFFVAPLPAQLAMQNPQDIDKINHLMSGEGEWDKLDCHVQTYKPFLDFAFRFEAGYVVRCSLAQFEGKESFLASYTRVRPVNGTPVVLADQFHIPAIPPERRQGFNWQRFHEEAEFSGVFAAGEGEYQVDLAILDNRKRLFQKSWKVKVVPHGKENKTPLVIKPYTAASTAMPPWHGHPEPTGDGPRITVFLDAAPIFPFALRLRAWDRAFLLTSLASLLHQVNASSARVVVFNLDQQRVVFQEENFRRSSFRKIVDSLQNLELGTVSYKNLQRQFGWLEMLTRLMNEEKNAVQSPDAIIFLGPTNRIMQKIPREYLESCQSFGSRIYYFEYFPYFGAEFPDTIHQLTNTCHGNVYKIHTAADFAEAIEKVQHKIQADGAESSRMQ